MPRFILGGKKLDKKFIPAKVGKSQRDHFLRGQTISNRSKNTKTLQVLVLDSSRENGNCMSLLIFIRIFMRYQIQANSIFQGAGKSE